MSRTAPHTITAPDVAARAAFWRWAFQRHEEKKEAAPTTRKDLSMIAPHRSIQDDSDQALLIALRAFLSRNPCASSFGPEKLSELLYKEHYLPRPASGYEVENAVEALRVEGEVLG